MVDNVNTPSMTKKEKAKQLVKDNKIAIGAAAGSVAMAAKAGYHTLAKIRALAAVKAGREAVKFTLGEKGTNNLEKYIGTLRQQGLNRGTSMSARDMDVIAAHHQKMVIAHAKRANASATLDKMADHINKATLAGTKANVAVFSAQAKRAKSSRRIGAALAGAALLTAGGKMVYNRLKKNKQSTD